MNIVAVNSIDPYIYYVYDENLYQYGNLFLTVNLLLSFSIIM